MEAVQILFHTARSYSPFESFKKEQLACHKYLFQKSLPSVYDTLWTYILLQVIYLPDVNDKYKENERLLLLANCHAWI